MVFTIQVLPNSSAICTTALVSMAVESCPRCTGATYHKHGESTRTSVLNTGLVRKDEHERFSVKCRGERLVIASHNPALAEIVVHDKNAARFEMRTDIGECLA